jgi:putative oxidoreductase
MNSRKLGRALVLLSVAAIILSIAWWATYYNEVLRALGQNRPLTHPLRCLLWTSDVCTQAKTIANLPRFPAYNPLAMWLSFVVLVLGLVVIFRSTSTAPYPVTPTGEPKLFIRKLEPFYAWTRDLAWPLIRVAVGGTLLVHGMGKVLNQDVMAFAARSMAGRGLEPSVPFAYVIYFNETAGAVLIMLGLFTRFAAASISIELFLITFLAHFGNGYGWTNPRGGWEFPLMWGAIFLAIALRGGGPYSLDRLLRHEL